MYTFIELTSEDKLDSLCPFVTRPLGWGTLNEDWNRPVSSLLGGPVASPSSSTHSESKVIENE